MSRLSAESAKMGQASELSCASLRSPWPSDANAGRVRGAAETPTKTKKGCFASDRNFAVTWGNLARGRERPLDRVTRGGMGWQGVLPGRLRRRVEAPRGGAAVQRGPMGAPR